VIAGVSLAVGVPPPLVATGWHGFLNELLGAAGVSAAWGGSAAGLPMGLALALRWAAQYLLLGVFAIVLGLRPLLALRPILWTVTGFGESLHPRVEPVATPGAPPAFPEGRLTMAPETDR